MKRSLHQEVFNQPQAQDKPEIQPDSMSDHVEWEAVAGIKAAVGHTALSHFRSFWLSDGDNIFFTLAKRNDIGCRVIQSVKCSS